MCRVLHVSRSGYYAWLQRPAESRWQQGDAALAPEIRSSYEKSDETYGAPRVQADLREKGIVAGQPRITWLMAEMGIRGVTRRPAKKSTTKRKREAPVAKDLVKHKFVANAPNELWVADATYIPTREGTLYLAIVLDVFARRIVGWSMAARQDSGLMVRALQMALSKRRPKQIIHHSDHGSQYTSKHFLETCRNANVQVSMGSVGDCYDNAMAESFFATLKCEVVRRQSRRCFQNRTLAKRRVFEYIEGYYNLHRRHPSLGLVRNRSQPHFAYVHFAISAHRSADSYSEFLETRDTKNLQNYKTTIFLY